MFTFESGSVFRAIAILFGPFFFAVVIFHSEVVLVAFASFADDFDLFAYSFIMTQGH